MLELKERRYTMKELTEFKNELKTNKNIDFLLNNIQALRLLGYQIKTGTRLKHEYMNGYYDVIRYDNQLPPRTMKLYIPKQRRANEQSTIIKG